MESFNVNQEFNAFEHDVVNRISAMLAYWDKDLVCRFANAAYLDWFGKTSEEMVDKMTIDELLGPLYLQNLPYIEGALAGKQQTFERTIATPAEGVRNSLANYYPDIVDGQVKGFYVHVADISPLVMKKQRLSTLLEVLPQIAWTINKEGEADYFNQHWYQYTGLDFDQTKGLRWQKIIHPDDLENALELFADLKTGAKLSDIEVRYKRADGAYRWHLIQIEPLRDTFGKVGLWIGTCTDIEELKQLRLLRDDFVNMASHELKSPLTSLRLTMQLLQQITKEEHSLGRISLLINRANLGVNKLVELLDELTIAAKMDDGLMQLSTTQFDLGKLVEECCEQIRLYSDSLHTLAVHRPKQALVTADRARISQVVTNLLNNAVKYSPESKYVDIIIRDNDNDLKVSIRDYGIGISAEKLALLFDKYYRVTPAGLQTSGLGLGLYICSEIIKRHGGKMGVESKPGKGSTFWFTLPV